MRSIVHIRNRHLSWEVINIQFCEYCAWYTCTYIVRTVPIHARMTSAFLKKKKLERLAVQQCFRFNAKDFNDNFSQFQILPLQLQPRHSITHSVPYPSSSSSSSIVTHISSSTTSDEYYLQQSLQKSSMLTDSGSYLWLPHNEQNVIDRSFLKIVPLREH